MPTSCSTRRELTDGGGGAGTLPPASAKVIVLATDVRDMGKQIWADVGLVGHPKTTLDAMNVALQASKPKKDVSWQDTAAQSCSAYRGQLRGNAAEGWNASPISLPRLFKETESVFGNDALIVDHSTTGTAHLLQRYGFPVRAATRHSRARSAQGWACPRDRDEDGRPNTRRGISWGRRLHVTSPGCTLPHYGV